MAAAKWVRLMECRGKNLNRVYMLICFHFGFVFIQDFVVFFSFEEELCFNRIEQEKM